MPSSQPFLNLLERSIASDRLDAIYDVFVSFGQSRVDAGDGDHFERIPMDEAQKYSAGSQASRN